MTTGTGTSPAPTGTGSFGTGPITNPGPALIFSGGGAKGDFEVGAAFFLLTQQKIAPVIFCGTSVGAINATKLAEGTPTALSELVSIWLNLMADSDMWVPQPWFLQANALASEVGLGWQTVDGIASSLVSTFALISNLQNLGKQVVQAGALLGTIPSTQSLYAFSSTLINMVTNQIDASKVAGSGLMLRIGMVDLENGNAHYANELGIIDAGALGTVALSSAVLASASIPVIFPPTQLLGLSMVDGGTRETVPVEPAIVEGAETIFALVPSASSVGPYVSPIPGLSSVPASGSFAQANLFDILVRAADNIASTAIQEYSIRAQSPGETLSYALTVIRPLFEIHDIFTIDPGLVSINMAYGYMRAGEVMVLGSAFGDSVTNEYGSGNQLSPLSDQIMQLRRQVWALEVMVNSYPMSPGLQPAPFPQPTLLATNNPATNLASLMWQIRTWKFLIRDLVCQYTRAPGFVSTLLPTPDFRPQTNATFTFQSWWMTWERHPWTPSSATPWAQFVDGNGYSVAPFPNIANFANPCTPASPILPHPVA
jgi:predicted acylesterase/phospholipase RssA